MNARAKLAIYNADGTLDRETEWGPWELLTTNLGRIMQGFLNSGISATKTLVDEGGTNRSVALASAATWTTNPNTSETYVRLGWGNGAAAPARGDSQISGYQTDFNASSRSDDETAATITLTGSVVSGATTNVTCLGLYVYFSVSGTPRLFLLDHSTVTSTPVTTGQTIAVTYQVAY